MGPAGDALKPVTLAITATATNGKANPKDRIAGFAYESPFVGDADGEVGASYNLYEYAFDAVSGVGSAAALAVPRPSMRTRRRQRASRRSPPRRRPSRRP